MIYLNIWLTVKEAGDIAKVSALLAEAGHLSRAESGCVAWEAYQSNNDASKFLIHEKWASQPELDVHRTAQAYTTIYHPQILPLVVREAHPSTPLE